MQQVESSLGSIQVDPEWLVALNDKSPVWRVYLITVEGMESCKIGRSANPKRRVKNLQTGSPLLLELRNELYMDSEARAFRVEHRLHRRFGHLALHGEWFNLDDSILEFFDRVEGLPPDNIERMAA